MAFTFTVTKANSMGNLRSIHGTFTSADGDTSMSLAPATHGLNYIADYHITLDTSAIDAQIPKVTISGGTITALWQDTQGQSGKFHVTGR